MSVSDALNSIISWFIESIQNPNIDLLIFIIICVFILFSLKVLLKKARRLPNIIYSYFRLSKLQKFKNDPRRQFGYLRYTNHFIFEEMILSAFKKLGFKIIRNKRYTGDGGIDGKIIIDRKVVLIQAKRYKGHINPRHVEEFSNICRNHGCTGLFVHTGKTGKLSRKLTNNIVDIVSGQRMLDLLNIDGFKVTL